jgi:hypothetical protein
MRRPRPPRGCRAIEKKKNTNLHFTTAKLTVFQRGAYFVEIKLFNHLPTNIKSLSNEIELFKPALKRFLLLQSFYSLDEYFNYNNS